MRLFKHLISAISISAILPLNIYGTHNRAGEITYKHISGFTFEITITTYTYQYGANREYLYIDWGDGTGENITRDVEYIIPNSNNYRYSEYTTQHTFPGTGVYTLLMEDPNRNLGIKNIPNSINTVFSIKTTMLIGSFAGTNSTPVLLNPPIDQAALNHIFIHNPAAYDPDGDSLSYELTVCTAEDGDPISNYSYPAASDSLYLDPITGDLIWNTPTDTGAYNIAMYVNEWRNGVKIGRIARDMQIDVYRTDNNPPEISPISDYCVEAGDTIAFEFTVTDADNDPINITMSGGPLSDSAASYEILEMGVGYVKGKFTWVTDCNHAREQPYTLVIRAQDEVDDVQLVDISSFLVRVLHSAPENLHLMPGTDTIRVNWDVTNCGNASGYKIYRRIGAYGFIPDSCENGVPAYTGYELLDVVEGKNTNYYTDDNLGQGLVPGYDYCYIVTATYDDNAESFASIEACTTLVSGTPPMLQVSVRENDADHGSILVSWAVPDGIDTLSSGPYRYVLYRQTPDEDTLSLLHTIESTDLLDTTYIDTNINTLEYPYNYSVKVFYQEAGAWILVPGSEVASSLYLNLYGADNEINIEMKKRAPWLNYEHHIFRKNNTSDIFDSIGYSTSQEYSDQNIPNNVTYTYQTRSLAKRPINGGTVFVENYSHINSAEAIDTAAPCAPKLSVTSECDSLYNSLIWTSPQTVCGANDVITYLIFYKSTLEGKFELIQTQKAPDTTFRHDDNLETLAAVYGVVAVDSFDNASDTAIVIIDTCQMYKLPNVFSPNNDGVLDFYTSYNLGNFVKVVDMQIFNRYGQLIFRTSDPDINWDGRHKDTKNLVSSGVYYYICDVYEPRLTGTVHKTLKGFIHAFSGNDNSNYIEE